MLWARKSPWQVSGYYSNRHGARDQHGNCRGLKSLFSCPSVVSSQQRCYVRSHPHNPDSQMDGQCKRSICSSHWAENGAFIWWIFICLICSTPQLRAGFSPPWSSMFSIYFLAIGLCSTDCCVWVLWSTLARQAALLLQNLADNFNVGVR